jgi:hypothetical protein
MAIGIGSDPVEDYGRVMQAGTTDGIDPSYVMAKYGDPGNLASAYADATGTDRQTAFNKLMAALSGSNPQYQPNQKQKQPGAYDRLTQQAAKNLGATSGLTDFTDPDAIAATGLQGLMKSYDNPYAPKVGQGVGSLQGFAGKRKPQPFPFRPITGGDGNGGYADGGAVDDGGSGSGGNGSYDPSGLGLDPLSSFLINAGASGLASGALNVGQAVGAGVAGGMQAARQNAQLGLYNRRIKMEEAEAPYKQQVYKAQAEELGARAPLYKAQAALAQAQVDDWQRNAPLFQQAMLEMTGGGRPGGGAGSGGGDTLMSGNPAAAPAAMMGGGGGGAAAAAPQVAGLFQQAALKPAGVNQPGQRVFSGAKPDGTVYGNGRPIVNLPALFKVAALGKMSLSPTFQKLGDWAENQLKLAYDKGVVLSSDGGFVPIPGWLKQQFDTEYYKYLGGKANEITQEHQAKTAEETQRAQNAFALKRMELAGRPETIEKTEQTPEGPVTTKQTMSQLDVARGALGGEPTFQPASGGGAGPVRPALPVTPPNGPAQSAPPAMPVQRQTAAAQPSPGPAAVAQPQTQVPQQPSAQPGFRVQGPQVYTGPQQEAWNNWVGRAKELQDHLDSAQQEKMTIHGALESLDGIMQGPVSERLTKVKEWIADLEQNTGQKVPQDLQDQLVKQAQSGKLTQQLVFNTVKAVGSRVLAIEMNQAKEANPNPGMLQFASKPMLHYLDAIMDRASDRAKFAADNTQTYAQHPEKTLQFDRDFNHARPIELYTARGMGRLPKYSPEVYSALQPGEQYLAPDGKPRIKQGAPAASTAAAAGP